MGAVFAAPVLHSGLKAANPGCLRAEPSFRNDLVRALSCGSNGKFRLVAGLGFRAKDEAILNDSYDLVFSTSWVRQGFRPLPLRSLFLVTARCSSLVPGGSSGC